MYSHMRVTAAYQNFQESRHDRNTNSTSIRNQYEEVNALSLNLDFDKVINSVFTMYYGFEAIGNLVKSSAYREEVAIAGNTMVGETTSINSRYPNGSTWQAYGGFVNLKYLLSEKWLLNGGARYSYYEINAEFDTTLFAFPVSSTKNANSALNTSLGIVFKANNT